MIGVPPYSPGDYLDVDRRRRRRRDDPARRLLPPAAAAHAGRRSRAARRGPRAARGSRLAIPKARSRPRSAKLEAALDLPDLVVDVGAPTFLDAVRDAVARHERVEIDYWSAGRDELTTRRDRPGRRLLRDGRLVRRRRTATAPTTSACSASIASAACAPTGEHFEPEPTGFESGEVYSPAPTIRR